MQLESNTSQGFKMQILHSSVQIIELQEKIDKRQLFLPLDSVFVGEYERVDRHPLPTYNHEMKRLSERRLLTTGHMINFSHNQDHFVFSDNQILNWSGNVIEHQILHNGCLVWNLINGVLPVLLLKNISFHEIQDFIINFCAGFVLIRMSNTVSSFLLSCQKEDDIMILKFRFANNISPISTSIDEFQCRVPVHDCY